jgi:3-oxoadipate enol-lactonase
MGVSMNYVTVGDGARIAYQWDGAEGAPVLILSNSLGTDRHMWDAQMAAFTRDFRVLLYDTRGHGASDAPVGGYSMDRLGRDVVELMDALAVERAHFCGLSLGGMIGQWMAVYASDRLDRLVLANTSAYMGPPANWQARINGVLKNGIAPLVEPSIARWFTPQFVEAAPDTIAQVRDILLANNPVGYAGCCAAIRDMDQRPTSQLNVVPTLVIAGAQDPATSVDDAQYLFEQAANARLEILDAAHLSNMECADEFAELASRFLRKLSD